MSDDKPAEETKLAFEGVAASEFRERREREEREAKMQRPQSGEEQVATQTGVPVHYDAKGGQHAQIEEPQGIAGYDVTGTQLGPFRARKYNRDRVLGRGDRANGPRPDDSDWIFDT